MVTKTKKTPVKAKPVKAAAASKHTSPPEDDFIKVTAVEESPMDICTPAGKGLFDESSDEEDKKPQADAGSEKIGANNAKIGTASVNNSPDRVASLSSTTSAFTPRRIASRRLQFQMAKKMSPSERIKKRNQVVEHVLRVRRVKTDVEKPEGATELEAPVGYMIALDTPASESDWPSKKIIDSIKSDNSELMSQLGFHDIFRDWHPHGIERFNSSGYNLRVFFAFIKEVENIEGWMNLIADTINKLPKIGRNRVVVAIDSYSEGVWSDWLAKDDTVELISFLCEADMSDWAQRNPHAVYCFWRKGSFPLDVAKRFGLPNDEIEESFELVQAE